MLWEVWEQTNESSGNLKRLTLEAVTEPTAEKVRNRLAWLFKDPATIPEDLVSSRLKIYSQPDYREVTMRTLCLQDMEVRLRNLLTESELEEIRVPTLWSGPQLTRCRVSMSASGATLTSVARNSLCLNGALIGPSLRKQMS